MRAFISALLLAAVAASPAAACSCRGLDNERDLIREAAIAFRGTAMAVESIEPAVQPTKWTAGRPAMPTIRFQLDRSFKGPPGFSEVLVSAEPPANHNCGVDIAIGENLLIVASGDRESGYQTTFCLMRLGHDESAFSRYRERTEALRAGLVETPTDPDHRRALAKHYFDYADWENLRDLLRDSQGPDLLAMRGEAEMSLAKTEAALASFHRALTADPTLAMARKGRVAALIKLDRRDGFGPASDFSGQKAPKLTLDGFDLTGSNFAGSDFGLLSVQRAILAGSDFRRAHGIIFGQRAVLRGADFRHAVFRGSLYKADAESADFRGAILSGLSFIKANLSGADFTGANLEIVDFSGARLTRAKFTGARLNDVKLPGADLSGQLLAGSSLRGIDLSGARLDGTDLRNADLSSGYTATRLHGADLSNALLEGAKLAGATYDCRTRWPVGLDPLARGAIPDATNCAEAPPASAGLLNRHAGPIRFNAGSTMTVFERIDLSGQSLAGMDLRRTQFILGTVQGTSFAGAWLDGSAFGGANMTGADFTGVDLRDVVFSEVIAPNLVLRRTVLGAKAILTLGGSLAAADLAGAAIAIAPKDWTLPFNPLDRGAFFLDVPQAVARFGQPDLRGADLSHRNLYQADFSGVDLSGANLTGAFLDQVNFRGANLTAVVLRGAVATKATRWPSGFDPTKAGVVHTAREPGNNSPQLGFACNAPHLRRDFGGLLAVPDFTGINMDGVNWATVPLKGARFAGASLRRARLECSDLALADLRKANLDNASLNRAALDDADLAGASLRHADLRQATLRGTELAGTDLTGALYDDSTVWPEGFDTQARGVVHE